MLFPQFVFDKDDGKRSRDEAEPGTPHHAGNHNEYNERYPNHLNEESKTTPGQLLEFEKDFPFVDKIEIDGNWFNKKPRAIIIWRDRKLKRKMADFKWLWRMLLLNSSAERVVPDYPNDIPESMWPQGYLRRRKRE